MVLSAQAAWQQAYLWLCQQRRHAPANSDVWHLRYHWARDGQRLLQTVLQGGYQLSPLQVIGRRRADAIALWGAQDALVLKWVAIRIAPYLPVHRLCHHLKGMGCHRSLQAVAKALHEGDYNFVYRTDIRGYYRNIPKSQLAGMVRRWVTDSVLCDLTLQFLHYSVEDGGEFFTPESGISRGCALSPLLGASLLHHVDGYFATCEEVFYVRYMDDFLLLTRTRWALRRAIRRLNHFVATAGFSLHPDKTQIGRVESGFDWLGIWFCPAGPTLAPRALTNHRERRMRLYEQARSRGMTEQAARVRVQTYEARWQLWAERLLRVARTVV